MKGLLRAVAGVVLVGAGLVAAWAWGVFPGAVLNVVMGAVCLAWLAVVLVLPWNLHFKARAVLSDMKRSRERDIRVDPAREAEVQRLARRTLWASVGLHVVSSAVVAAATHVAGWDGGYWFAGMYLLSTFFRPAHALHNHLWMSLQGLAEEVRYPRTDVVSLVGEVAALRRDVDGLDHRQRHDWKGAREEQVATAARLAALEQRLEATTRVFEDALNRLTDNREVISGIKAFLRLVRADGNGA